MRTKALLCAAGILAAGVATSMAAVNSLNTVGYVTAVPGAGNYIAICNPVTNTSMANTLGNLVQTNLPVNSKVLKWNYAAVHFDIYTRVDFGNGWSPSVPTNNVGEGFFTSLAAPYTWVENFTVQ